MHRQIPLASAALSAQSGLPPFAVMVRAHRTRSDDESLLRPCVEISLEVHPSLQRIWAELGVREGATRFHVSKRHLPQLLAPLCAGVVAVRGRRGFRSATSAGDVETSLDLRDVVLPTGRRPASALGMQVRLSRTANSRVLVELVADGVRIAGSRASSSWRRVVGVEDAVALIDTLTERVVLDGSAGAWSSLVRLQGAALTASPVSEAPGLASIREGFAQPLHLTAAEALDRLAAAGDIRSVACHSDVADMAAIQVAAPVCDELLMDHQSGPVGAYLASPWGVLCALPPGSGKTVVAARALHHRSHRGATLALVVAPAQLRAQWQRELTRFHPEATVVTLDARTKRAELVGYEALVVLASYEMAVRHEELLASLAFDDLVVDEAGAVLGRSRRSRVLARLRSTSTRALLLTGTPQERSIDDVGGLVAFVLDRDVFASVPLSVPHLASWEDRVGALLQGLTSHDADQALPELKRRVVEVVPSSDEVAMIAQAGRELDEARAALAAAAENDEKRRARILVANAVTQLRDVLGDPAAAQSDGVRACAERALLAPSKRTALIAILRDCEPTVVCTRSARTANALAEVLNSVGIASRALTATTTHRDRERAALDLGTTLQVVVVSQTSAVGWDLPGARRVVHLDVPASRAEELQRSSRARRVSSVSDAVDVVFLTMSGTSEPVSARTYL